MLPDKNSFMIATRENVAFMSVTINPCSSSSYVSTKFHFDETMSARVGVVDVRRSCQIYGNLVIIKLCNFGATVLGFDTVITNIILPGI